MDEVSVVSAGLFALSECVDHDAHMLARHGTRRVDDNVDYSTGQFADPIKSMRRTQLTLVVDNCGSETCFVVEVEFQDLDA